MNVLAGIVTISGSKDLWKQVKKTVREIESEDGILIFDDTVQEKPYMDENDLICWHYDHCKGRNIKGVKEKRKKDFIMASLKSNAAFAKSPAHTVKT